MQQPLELKVDFVAMAGYLRYRVLESGVHVARTQRISDDVFVDFNAESQIVGVELLAFDDEALDVARRFAAKQDLEFPNILAQRASLRREYRFEAGSSESICGLRSRKAGRELALRSAALSCNVAPVSTTVVCSDCVSRSVEWERKNGWRHKIASGSPEPPVAE